MNVELPKEPDYASWVGKKVYVSDFSKEQAEIYKESQDPNQCGTLIDIATHSHWIFYAKSDWWKYAVLADEY